MLVNLPNRLEKPRDQGLNIIIDNGYPTNHFLDTIESFHMHIDFVKFGWGTSLVSPNIDTKIDILKRFNIEYFMGGTLFEKFYHQNSLDSYIEYCMNNNIKYIEISNGTIDLSNDTKAKVISDLSSEFIIFSEVGYKNDTKSSSLTPQNWLEFIEQDLNAGAHKVLLESRESGRGGICNSNGEIKLDILKTILNSNLDLNNIVFEAPTRELQQHLINNIDINVNLANISLNDIISLETLRYGLRADTFFCQ